MMWRSPSPQGYVAPVIDMQQVSELAPFLRPCGHTHRTAQRSSADNKAQPCMMELPWHQVVSKRPACSSSACLAHLFGACLLAPGGRP